MECIICPTDFSENAKKATNWAAFLSSKLKIPLHLYNCYHIPVMVNDIPFPMGTEVEMENGLNTIILAEVKRINEIYKELEIKYTVEAGFANESILEYASIHNAKLIVIGISGRTTTGQILIGSTAIKVSLNSKIPVLIIPSHAKSQKIERIAIACDFTRKEKVADINLFFDLVKTFNAYIKLVHVSKKAETQVINPENKIEDFEKHKYVVHTIEDDSVEPGLVHFTDRNKIDMLAVIHKKHGFFERIFTRSHTGKLAFKINVPLLVLHEEI